MTPTHPGEWSKLDAPDDADRLASRVALLGTLGWLCVLTALAAPLLLCGGALLYGPESAFTGPRFGMAVAGVLVPLAALGVWAVVLRGVRSLYVGRLRIARIAEDRGWAFREQPAAPQRTLIDTFRTFASEKGGVGAIAWSRDLRPTVVTDLVLPFSKHTAILFTDAARGLPGLIIQPRDVVLRLVGGDKGVPVSGQQEFNHNFALLTAHETVREATAAVTPAVVRFCLEEGDVVLETRGGHLLVWWDRGIIKPEEFDERLKRAEEVVKLLRAG